jgi:hypothetical protein
MAVDWKMLGQRRLLRRDARITRSRDGEAVGFRGRSRTVNKTAHDLYAAFRGR